MSWISDPAAWSALVALLVLEIVLGVDNVIFISIIAAKLPAEMQDRARRIGLLAAGGMRVLLLLSVGWIISLKEELFAFSLWGWDLGFSGKELILLAGGVFLLYKATKEIHHKLEGVEEAHGAKEVLTFGAVIGQVMLLDLVFSLDSVFTAVGLAQHVEIMVAAIVIAVVAMMFLAAPINAFIDRHPTIKILALAFLILVGMALVADALEFHIPKGYLYFAMAFSVGVEMVNLRLRKRSEPVDLRP